MCVAIAHLLIPCLKFDRIFNTVWDRSPKMTYIFLLASQSRDDQIQVIGNLKNISMASSKLLLAAKSLSVDPNAANAKNLLAVAARCAIYCMFHFTVNYVIGSNGMTRHNSTPLEVGIIIRSWSCILVRILVYIFGYNS